jgi:hypothetical protein
VEVKGGVYLNVGGKEPVEKEDKITGERERKCFEGG